MMQTELFIGGQWRSASDGATFPIIDPSTEESIAEVSSATVDDVIAGTRRRPSETTVRF